MSTPSLAYHQVVFDIIEQEPELVDGSRSLLDNCERALGFALPAALREWYLIANSNRILEHYSNDDHPVSPKELLEVASRRGDYSHFHLNLAAERVLPFLWENQAVFLCGLQLDDSDDPPVVAWDDDHVWKKWQSKFSTFLSLWVWDFLYFRDRYDFSLCANDTLLTEQDFAAIRRDFIEVQRRVDNSSVYHLHKADQHIRIWLRGNGDVLWWLAASTKESLLDLAQRVWHVGTLASTLTIQGGSMYSPASKVLQLLRLGHELPETRLGKSLTWQEYKAKVLKGRK